MKPSSCQSIRVGASLLNGQGSMQTPASPRQASRSPDIDLLGEIALKQPGQAQLHSSGR